MSKKESTLSKDGRNALRLSLIRENVEHLMGKVLTIIDASVLGEQNKAVKDLIKNSFYQKQDWFVELAWWLTPKEQGRLINDWEGGLVDISGDIGSGYRE